ncbi:MAG: peptidase M14 [Acidobacteria bacterium]|nr:peptidase M14 [Acidobacteriota bacterium]
MTRSSSAVLLVVLLCAGPLSAALPTPESHFGFRMGTDRKLVDWDGVVGYYRKLDAASDSVRVEELGKTTEGRPFLLATIARPETLAKLSTYQSLQARLADPRATTPAQAETLIEQGKTVVLLTCSIHSSEPASTMTAMEFVYRLLSEDTPRHRKILDETILLLTPSLNPDGVDKVAEWYRRYVGSPYEGAPMVDLYHKYVGHDNNRDWYMFTQQETRLAVEKIHNVWRPQIVYDVHQMGSTGARIFLPPWDDPVDPNIDSLIVQQVNEFGTAMAVDLTAAGRKGVVMNGIYDYFTPARHYQSYHGGLRLLTESASVRYATPITIPFSALQQDARGYNAQQRSWNFLEPWPGGRWRLRDIVDDQLIAFESCLYNAALKRPDLLRNFYRIGRRGLEAEGPKAFILPGQQHDPNALTRLLETLDFGMVEIQRAARDFRAGGRAYSEGDYVISLEQPYGRFAKTLLEKQKYPDLREYAGGPPQKPYDVTAHSLPLLLGVSVDEINRPFQADLQRVDSIRPPTGRVGQGELLRLSPAWSYSWKAVNRLLADGATIRRNETTGDFYVPAGTAWREELDRLATDLGLRFESVTAPPSGLRQLRTPRVGVYSGFVPIMDEGWTRWVLDDYGFEHKRLDNERAQRGDLRSEFDAIILPDASPRTLHAGYIEGASYRGAKIPPEFSGGLGDAGAAALREFAMRGGVILAFNEASNYAIERLGLQVENTLGEVSSSRFYSPGALLETEVDLAHPLCFGMQPRQAVWFESGPAFRPSFDREGPAPKSVLRYPGQNVLASGWLLGEELIAARSAVMDVPVGRGRVVLFGIRPQYRGQSNATFKMVFNGLFYWAD